MSNKIKFSGVLVFHLHMARGEWGDPSALTASI